MIISFASDGQGLGRLQWGNLISIASACLIILLSGCGPTNLKPRYYETAERSCFDLVQLDICKASATPKEGFLWRGFFPESQLAREHSRREIQRQIDGVDVYATFQPSTDPIKQRWNAIALKTIGKDYWLELLNEQINPNWGDAALIAHHFPLGRVDLDNRSRFLELFEGKLRVLLEEMLDTARNEGVHINRNQTDMIRTNFEKFINKIPEIERKINDSDELYELLFRYWDFSRFMNELKKFIGNGNLSAFIINSNKKISPRVSAVGNLYIDTLFWNQLSEHEKNLVLHHEAGHVAAMALEYLGGFSYDLINSLGNSDNDDFALKIMKIAGNVDETLVDLIALHSIDASLSDLEVYENLMESLEPAVEGRAATISSVRDYISAGFSIERLLRRRLIIGGKGCGSGVSNVASGNFHMHIGIPEITTSMNEAQVLYGYHRGWAKYQAKRIPRLLKAVGTDITLSPSDLHKMERQLLQSGTVTITHRSGGRVSRFCFSGGVL